jgi:thiol-disulfide isomerase/thioredoxin
MKNIVFLFAILLIVSCKSNEKKEVVEEKVEEPVAFEMKSAENLLVPDEEDGGEMLIGPIDRNGLQMEPFIAWYTENDSLHVVDTTLVAEIKPLLASLEIKVFMGSWCEDSQKLVPALFKVLDAANFNYSNLEMIALDHDKKSPNGLEEGYKIEYVPTIIFLENGKELNRIVEYEIETLEKDMFKIVNEEPYKNVYAE